MANQYRVLYDSQDDIPATIEDFPSLFTEKSGKWELTGMPGLFTQANIDRLETSLSKEREDHKATKAKLEIWADLDHDEIMKKLDRIPELEAAADGKLDDAKIEELANKRVDGMISTRTAPLERELKKAHKLIAELTEANERYVAKDVQRSREDMIRPVMTKAGILPEHHDDVLLYAERHFERSEDGKFFVRDGVTVNGNALTSGASAGDWLEELIGYKPGWLPPSKNAGGRPGAGGGGAGGGENPWTAQYWNKTKQAQYAAMHGEEKAKQMAARAGVTIDATHPAPVAKT